MEMITKIVLFRNKGVRKIVHKMNGGFGRRCHQCFDWKRKPEDLLGCMKNRLENDEKISVDYNL